MVNIQKCVHVLAYFVQYLQLYFTVELINSVTLTSDQSNAPL